MNFMYLKFFPWQQYRAQSEGSKAVKDCNIGEK